MYESCQNVPFLARSVSHDELICWDRKPLKFCQI